MRPDKEKVVDEIWDDARIESFLHKGAMGDENEEFSILLYAYRSMRLDDFEKFIALYRERGFQVDARGLDGRTLAEVISSHDKSAGFLAALG